MGCCLGAVLLAGTPRLALALWWFFDPARVEGAFNWTTVIGGWTVPAWLWAVLGFVFLPWVTVALVFVAPRWCGRVRLGDPRHRTADRSRRRRRRT